MYPLKMVLEIRVILEEFQELLILKILHAKRRLYNEPNFLMLNNCQGHLEGEWALKH